MVPPLAKKPSPPKTLRGYYGEVRAAFVQTPRVVRLVLEADPAAALGIMVLSFASALLPLAVAYLGKLIIDGVLAAVASKDPAASREVMWLVGAELGLMLLMGLLARSTGLLRSLLGTRLGYLINLRILAKARTLDLVHFETPAVYDKLQNARREASSRPLNLFISTVDVVSNVVTLASYAVVLFTFSGFTLLILVAATVPAFISEARFSGEAFRLFTWRAPEGRRMRYLEILLTRDDYAKEVKLFGLGDLLLERYRGYYEKFFGEERSLAVRRAVWGFVLGAFSTAALYGCYAWIAARTVAGALTLGDMTLYMAVFRQGQGALRTILRAIGGTYEDNLFMSNLFSFLGLRTTADPGSAPTPPRPDAATAEPDEAAPDQAGPDRAAPDQAGPAHAASDQAARDQAAPDEAGPDRAAPDQAAPDEAGPDEAAPDQAGPAHAASDRAAPDDARPDEGAAVADPAPRVEAPVAARGFDLRDVSFRYPGRPQWILRHLDLHIGPEESLAIVGSNGAGKTTLIKLLAGLYPPTEGTITLDGRLLHEYPQAELWRRFGVVLQDFVRYQFTAKENVGLGLPDALDDLARIEAAAAKGGADQTVANLPQGWDTQLGRWFDGGVELSMGNWQKVAVSRAFMRDADILVLDEPTAALDAEAEHALFQRFRDLTRGKMALLISHRFSTVRMADRIAVMVGGQIAELGTHESLMKQDGRYARLFGLQAEGYLGADVARAPTREPGPDR